jgi:hypothetical protein
MIRVDTPGRRVIIATGGKIGNPFLLAKAFKEQEKGRTHHLDKQHDAVAEEPRGAAVLPGNGLEAIMEDSGLASVSRRDVAGATLV